MESIFYTCSYCNRDCTIDNNDITELSSNDKISPDYGYYFGIIQVITCPNPSCRKQKISASLYEYDPVRKALKKELYCWQLLPESEAKIFPNYIPEQLRNDYAEACLIKNKSPKASATLSRRCLQGMIRDFWKIKRRSLFDEIKELENLIDKTTWEAIDSVRQVGNIGAHMEHDVNLIIDVDEDEASLLIWLIETLFREWYIVDHERKNRMKALSEIASKKKSDKN